MAEEKLFADTSNLDDHADAINSAEREKQKESFFLLVEIPSSFWSDHRKIVWHDNRAEVIITCYDRIQVDFSVVEKLWPIRGIKSNRGKPPTFDEPEFLRFCIYDVVARGFPKTQAELIRRMADLISVIWDKEPSETWYNEAVARIWDLKPEYEKGAKKLLRRSGR